MNINEFLKYIILIVFFGVVLAGIYFLLKRLGVMG